MDAHQLEPTLRNLLRESLDVEQGPHPAWAGSPAARRVAERQRRRWPATAVAAAAVLVVAIVGVPFLAGGSWLSGIGATDPAQSPALLARGTIVDRDWGPVDLAATGSGTNVTGRMTIGRVEESEIGYLVVDLRCARATEDGLITIGGPIQDGAGIRFKGFPKGSLAGILLKPGAPPKMTRLVPNRSVLAKIWVGAIADAPATQTTDCLAYLDAMLAWDRATHPDLGWAGGSVEVGP
jgi:hypothetical protein